MTSLVVRKARRNGIPALYLVYGYREIEEPNRWYVGSCLYHREQRRDDQHRRRLGDAKKFHRELKKVAAGRCFDELVQKVVLEIVWGTRRESIDRENIQNAQNRRISQGYQSLPFG